MNKGRKRITIDVIRFWHLYSKWISGKISQKEICNELKISRATFARRLEEYRKLKKDESTVMSQILKNPASYRLNQINVANGLDMLKSINNSTIKTTFFDPQYRGVLDHLSYGNEGLRQNKRISLPQMNDKTISQFMKEIDRVLIPSGYCFFWTDKYILGEGNQYHINTTLKPVDLLTWNKQRIGMGYRLRNSAEYLLVLQKQPIIVKNTWQNHAIPDVWNEKVKHPHPHAKPAKLIKELILATSKPGDIVLDPCAGSYAVLQAVSEIGDRHFLGCDLISPFNPAITKKD